jgi:hypothetical protein
MEGITSAVGELSLAEAINVTKYYLGEPCPQEVLKEVMKSIVAYPNRPKYGRIFKKLFPGIENREWLQRLVIKHDCGTLFGYTIVEWGKPKWCATYICELDAVECSEFYEPHELRCYKHSAVNIMRRHGKFTEKTLFRACLKGRYVIVEAMTADGFTLPDRQKRLVRKKCNKYVKELLGM